MLLKRNLFFIILSCLSFQLIHAKELEESFQTNDKMRAETRYVIHSLETLHYSQNPIAKLDNAKVLYNYMSDLDYNHIFLLESDVDGFIQRFAPPLTSYLRQGNIFPAFEIYKTFRNRLNERIDWVLKRLDEPFDFSQDDTFIPDRHKMPWPKDMSESDDLWEKRLKFDILNEILIDSKEDFQSLLGEALENSEDVDDPVTEGIENSKDSEAVEPAPTESKEDKSPQTSNTEHNADSIKNEASPSLAISPHSSNDSDFENKFSKAKSELKERYERIQKAINDRDAEEVQEIFLNTVTASYDLHSTFFSASTLEDFSIAIRNSLVGIGALLYDKDGYCTIKEIIPGGPAEKTKLLKPNDQIVAVAQGSGKSIDVVNMKLRKVVKLIRGKKGTEVKLTIRPADGDPSDRKVITLTRDEIKLTQKLSQAEVFEVPYGNETFTIGAIDVPAFYGYGYQKKDEPSTSRDVEELIQKLKAMGIQGIVLDLRRNGGGLLEEAISLTGLFIPIGPVLQARDANGRIREYIDDNPKIVWDGPLIVLVSKYSASASEIFVGALKTYHRALIVGDEHTYGKGTVQAVFEMDRPIFSRADKAPSPATKITIQKWYLPDGNSTQMRGVASDIVLPSVNEYMDISEADQDNPLPWDSIKPLAWSINDKVALSNELIQELKDSSATRQNSLTEFDYLHRFIQHFQEKQEQKEFSLNLEKRRKIRESDVAIRDKMENELKSMSEKLHYSSEKILLDIALKNTDGRENDHSDSDYKDSAFDFDIDLRETLRIMVNWIIYQDNPTLHKSIIAAPAIFDSDLNTQ